MAKTADSLSVYRVKIFFSCDRIVYNMQFYKFLMVKARKIAVLRGQEPKFNFMAQVFLMG